MTHVLIVEDHEENRNLIRMLLEANGYRVTVAGDGLDALAAAQRDPPDAIVSDVLMPRLDGFALCRAWMQDAQLKGIPFIFYSATNVRPEDEEFGLALGAVSYLIKPLEAKVLLEEVRAVLQQGSGRAARAPAPPLDNVIYHTLHEMALARKLEDKVAQLEAANRKLQESEARLRSLTEMSSDFYWESDAEHRIIARGSANKDLSAVTAFRGGAKTGERRWEIAYLSPDEAGWLAHRAVLDAHQPFRNFELSRLGTDGTEHFVSISGDPVFDASGAFTGYRGVGTDITERKRAESALRQSEDRYRDLVDNSGDLICTHDLDGKLLSVNAAAARLTGYSREALLRMEMADLLARGARDGFTAYLAEIRTKGKARGLMQIRTADGNKRWWEYHNTLRTEGVAAPVVRGMAQDVTERKLAEDELRARELRYEAVLNSATDAFVTGDAAGRIVGWNPSAGRIFGYAETEAVGQPLTLLIPQRFQDRHLDGMKRAQSGGERRIIGKTVELVGRRKDASEFPLELSLAEWTVGAGKFFTGIIRDITERKVAEAKIERLTQLYAALSQCNDAIVRCASEEELFPQICRDAVQFGGMEMAWIGIVDPDTRIVRIAARFGDCADDYLQGIEISVDADHPGGRGPTGTVIRENQPVWRQDFMNEPLTAPWHERRVRFGFGASASLPLHRSGVAVGVLTLYAAEVGAFDEASCRLLVEMATNISFALDNFAREAARERAEQDLRAAEEQFRGLVEQSIAGSYIIQDGRFAYVNPRFAEIFGYDSADEMIGLDPLSIVHEKDRGTSAENIRRRIDGEVQIINYGFTALRKDGSTIEVGTHGTRATYRGRPAVIGLMQDVSEKKRAEEQIQLHVAQLENAFMSTVQVVTALGEMRDPYTAGHQRRVAEIAVAIGAELGFDARRREGLRVAGYLHDIGKIRIPSEILSKPGKLGPVEFRLVQGHAQASYDVLKDVKFPWPVAEVALQHHERMDGSGYPQGLKGEAIALEARIIAVADVIEAMSSHRPYRAGLGMETALAEIERGRGSAYDAEVTDACLRLFRDRHYQFPL